MQLSKHPIVSKMDTATLKTESTPKRVKCKASYRAVNETHISITEIQLSSQRLACGGTR